MTLLLAILLCGYFVLAGLDYGVALVASGRPDLDRISPYFLGNEVWLVAAVGLLLGAFPVDEGLLLGAYRVPVTLALVGVVLVTAAFGLRIFSVSDVGGAASFDGSRVASPGTAGAATFDGSRVASPGAGRVAVPRGGGIGPLDGIARIGGALAALGWGAVLGAVWQGGPFRLSFTVVACSLGLLAVVGVHGWAFLRRRWAVLAASTAGLIGSVAVVGTSVTWHPASSAATGVLQPVAYGLVPLVIVIQGATWWMFRTRHLSEPTGTGPATSA